MIFAGPKVFLPAGEIMVKSLVITFIGKNNPANMKCYTIIHGSKFNLKGTLFGNAVYNFR